MYEQKCKLYFLVCAFVITTPIHEFFVENGLSYLLILGGVSYLRLDTKI